MLPLLTDMSMRALLTRPSDLCKRPGRVLGHAVIVRFRRETVVDYKVTNPVLTRSLASIGNEKRGTEFSVPLCLTFYLF